MHLYSKSKHVLGVTPVTELAGAGRRVKAPGSMFSHMDVYRDGFLNLGSVAIWS